MDMNSLRILTASSAIWRRRRCEACGHHSVPASGHSWRLADWSNRRMDSVQLLEDCCCISLCFPRSQASYLSSFPGHTYALVRDICGDFAPRFSLV